MALDPLSQRILTAGALFAVLLPAFLLLPKAFGLALIGLFVLGAAWEWSGFLGLVAMAPRLAGVALVALLLVATRALMSTTLPVTLIAACAMLWWLAAFALILRFPVSIRPAVAAVCGLLVLIPAWICLVALLYTAVNGRMLLLLVLAIVWAADIGAYFAGRRLGRVKLAPRVSPGKTWEGVLGGLACASVAAVAGAVVLGHPPGPAAALGLSVGAISIVGDLTVSMFKRNAGLKDSGNLFPGHGGILDRIDSVTAAAPLFLLEAGWLGWLGA
ncbi:phosphatidate cytidylyltransferase [Gammaproteobacteria bacterium]|nr:phosphatidate cytidylyltransferase [Gammaproteobacteria bacterium]QOJ31311.1 MAG: phosphatidate cytidylyltransferase [Gammaproteobacteria bacterium]CAG0939231.1 phosphatidate cytidylyltransferase [Gammaproteobacteria bacterium]